MTRTATDTRQTDLFALFAAPPPMPAFSSPAAAASPLADLAQLGAHHRALLAGTAQPAPEPEPLAATDACTCTGCGEEGEAAEFAWHDEAGGALCPECLRARETSCADCGKRFDRDRRFVRPTGRCVCWQCNEWKAMHKPQRDLTADEATDEARARMATLPWLDDGHRNRAIYRLRGGFESAARLCNADAGKAAKAKARRDAMIDAKRVERLFRITRHRPLQVLADEAWPLIVRHDAAMRAGEEHDAATWQQVDDLLAEANGGTSCGIEGWRRDFPGPARLWTLLRWRARRERRAPMWGVPCAFRVEWNGMHVICQMGNGRNRHSDGFHIDRDRQRPGDPCFSETGYRSMGLSAGSGCSPEQAAIAALDHYLRAPVKDGMGLGGQLKRWIPWEARPWIDAQRDDARDRSPAYRRDHPAMKAAEDRPAYWQRTDRIRREAADEALRWMQARGVDPYALFPDAPRQAGLL